MSTILHRLESRPSAAILPPPHRKPRCPPTPPSPTLRRHDRRFEADVLQKSLEVPWWTLGGVVRPVQDARPDPREAGRRIPRRLPAGQGGHRGRAADRRRVPDPLHPHRVPGQGRADRRWFAGALPRKAVIPTRTTASIRRARRRCRPRPLVDLHAEVVVMPRDRSRAGQARTQARPHRRCCRPVARPKRRSCSTACPPTCPPTTAR